MAKAAIGVHNMLLMPPESAKEEVVENWTAVLRNSFEIIVKSWSVVETKLPIFSNESYYDSWTDQNGHKITGMRNTASKEKHGIVRGVDSVGGFYEASFLNGQEHGLYIRFWYDRVYIILHKEGKYLSYFTFDLTFKELKRVGNALNFLNPQHFNPSAEKVLNNIPADSNS